MPRRGYVGLSKTLLAFHLAAWTGGAMAQSSANLTARLHTAALESSIDAQGLLPWHLKLDIQLFDTKGKPTEQGTVEEWWGSPALRHVKYTMPSFSGSFIENKDGLFMGGGGLGPVIVDELLEQIVHPMPHEEDIDQSKPDLRKKKFGKVELDCIMLDQPLKNVDNPPLGLFPTFCLDPGKNSLRITTEPGSIEFLRNRVGTFQKRLVSTEVSGNVDGVQVASAHVSSLATSTLSDADFTPDATMKAVSRKSASISGGEMAGMILEKVQPVYPAQAKQDHVSGTVVLHALIGRDGGVHSLHIISTPDSDLAIAAIAAVRKWRYKPFLVNGLPTEVDTTVTVNFRFGPG